MNDIIGGCELNSIETPQVGASALVNSLIVKRWRDEERGRAWDKGISGWAMVCPHLWAKHLGEIKIHTHKHTHKYSHTAFLFLIHWPLSDGACSLTGVAEGILCTSAVNGEGLRLYGCTLCHNHSGPSHTYFHCWLLHLCSSKRNRSKLIQTRELR